MAVRVDVNDIELGQVVPRRLEDAEWQVELPVVGEAVVEIAEAADEDAVDRRLGLAQALCFIAGVGRPDSHRLAQPDQ